MKLKLIDEFKKDSNFFYNLIKNMKLLSNNNNQIQRRQYSEDSKVFSINKEMTFAGYEKITIKIPMKGYERLKIVRIEQVDQNGFIMNFNDRKIINIESNNYILNPQEFTYINNQSDNANFNIILQNPSSKYKQIHFNIYYYIDSMIFEQSDEALDSFDEFEYAEFPIHTHNWSDIQKQGSKLSDIDDVDIYIPETYLYVDNFGNLTWKTIDISMKFKDLDGIPNYTSSDSGKIFRISSDGESLELTSPANISKLEEIPDVPLYIGNKNKVLQVNRTENGIRYIEVMAKDELYQGNLFLYHHVNLFDSDLISINVSPNTFEPINDFMQKPITIKPTPTTFTYSVKYKLKFLLSCNTDILPNEFSVRIESPLGEQLTLLKNSNIIIGKSWFISDNFVQSGLNNQIIKVQNTNSNNQSINIHSIIFEQYIERS